MGLRRWEDLDFDVLATIFSAVPTKDLFRNVSFVCRSWRLACWDVLFWSETKTLDFNDFAACLAVQFWKLSKPKPKLGDLKRKWMRQVESIMEGNGYDRNGFPLEIWRRSITRIFIPDHFILLENNHLLASIAQRGDWQKLPSTHNAGNAKH
ncbi:hypothetical protein CCACVL1_22478 [Corchorus capsularis]|uniref:F-box domain-containing protein n=1 Tax=Corchorus capsularis TaxID=210143 RepID=A0A1R3GYD8_COCAP|nr:hypothetical protein CCACVL1_22478 [Corchorus capsularis]